jgi:hypothetical protein
MSHELDDWGSLLASRVSKGSRIIFDHITNEGFESFKSYQDSHGLRWKCHYYPNIQQLQLTTPASGHEATSDALSAIIHNWNLANFPLYAGIPGAGPLNDFRSADVKQTNFQGDWSLGGCRSHYRKYDFGSWKWGRCGHFNCRLQGLHGFKT